MPIFCIGDSHVSLFAGVNKIQRVCQKKVKNLLPFFQVLPLGPVLSYNLVSSNTRTKGREILFRMLKKKKYPMVHRYYYLLEKLIVERIYLNKADSKNEKLK